MEEKPGNPPVKRQALWGQTGRKDVAAWAGQGPMCPTALPADPDFLELSPHFGSFWDSRDLALCLCMCWGWGHTSPELNPNPGSDRERGLPVGQELESFAWL